MLKLTMLKSRPAPGGELLCYLEGQTYELATDAEVAMGEGFIADGSAEAAGYAEAKAQADDYLKAHANPVATITPAAPVKAKAPAHKPKKK